MNRILLIIAFALFLLSNSLLCAQTIDSIPSSDYSDYRFKFGGGGSIGGAYVIPLGDFEEIRQDYGTVNFNILFSFHRIIYDFDLVLGNSKAQGTYSNNELNITEDLVVAVHSIENTLGYMVIDNRRMLMYPWVGVSSTKVSQNKEVENNEGPDRAAAVGGLTLGYRFGNVFSETEIYSFEVRSRIAYTALQYFDNLDISNIRLGLSFALHIRGIEKRKTI